MAEVTEVKQAEQEKPVVDLAAEARKEWEASKANETGDTPDAEPKELETKPADLPKEKPAGEETKLPEETKKDEPKVEDAKPEEKKEETVKAEDDEKVVQEWAIKHGLTLEEAKEDLAKTKSVVEKYKTPEEMARTLRHLQSEHDKLKNVAEAKPEVDPYKVSANPRLEVYQFVHANQDKLVENFRNQYPAKSRDMEDDAVLEEVSERILNDYQGWNNNQKVKMSSDARSKRDQLLSSINEADRQFLPDVKAVLDKTSDRSIVSNQFSLTDVLAWAKGQQYDKRVKEAEERGYKRGKEEAKILGVIPSASPKGGTTPVKKGVALNEYEKRMAREMFGTTSFSDEEKYEAYIEVTKKGKKK